MGWRETIGATVSDSKPIDEIDKTDKTPLFVNSVNSVNAPESGNLPKPRTRAGLRLALAEAGEGLPVTVAELVAAFGAVGEADWTEGYEAHCRPEFLRAFAAAVSERLERERRAKPEPPRQPHPLDGLALLREDWAFVERRTGGRNREALLNQYAERWKAAAALEPVEFRKANVGRFAANTWLRGVGR